jgi:hypothetical protein
MTDPKFELLEVIESYESAAKVLVSSNADAASYFSGLRPTIESATACLRRLVNTIDVRSRSDQERFRQVLGQARSFLSNALADMHKHALVCVYDLLRGVKTLLQDLIHLGLVDEDRVLAFERSDIDAIARNLKFLPRRGSKLRAAIDSI